MVGLGLGITLAATASHPTVRNIRLVELSPEMIHGWLGMFKRFFLVAAYPVSLAASLVFRILQSLLYGAIGLLFASMLKTELGYPAAVRLAVIAVTPVVLLDTVFGLAGVTVPYGWLLGIGIALGYLFFGVRAAAEPETAPRPV